MGPAGADERETAILAGPRRRSHRRDGATRRDWPRPGAAAKLADMVRRTLIALLLLLPGAHAARAWGEPGHRVVAEVAQARLAPASRAEVSRLLALDGATRLAEVANWADALRKAGGARGAETERWHFVNFASGCRYAPARDCPDGRCVIAALNRQAGVLGDRDRPDAERLEALKWVVHLVGDAHQPMHATGRDLGGNRFQVQLDGKGSNLHSVWDRALPAHLLRRTGTDEAGFAQSLLAAPPLPPDPTLRSDRRTADWAEGSCRLVDSAALFPDSHVLDARYLDAHAGLATVRLRRAGERLAAMLDAALDTARAPGAASPR
jgi:hypothetical protein